MEISKGLWLFSLEGVLLKICLGPQASGLNTVTNIGDMNSNY